MQSDKTILPLDFYYEHLTKINGVRFTPREVDVIACILNRRATAISSFLLIGQRAVESHIRNIRQKAGDLAGRDNIIDFVEKSDKFSLIKNEYYFSLRLRILFEEKLRAISKKLNIKSFYCLLVYESGQKCTPSLITYLKEHLKYVGFEVKIYPSEGDTFFTHPNEIINLEQVNHVLYSFHQNLSDTQISQINTSHLSNVIFLFHQNTTPEDVYKKLKNNNYMNMLEKENYYLSFFEVLKKLLPHSNFESIIEEFKQQYTLVNESIELESPQESSTTQKELFQPSIRKNFVKGREWSILIGLILAVSLLSLGFFMIWGETEEGFRGAHFTTQQSESSVRSDLILPNETTVLHRPELMAQIDNKFKEQKGGIQTIAIIGMGGAGKTTLARAYAHSQKANIIWEINAETPQSLKTSFETFAYALAQTEKDRKKLMVIQDIKDLNQREMRIIQFVKDLLKLSQNWFLIYDNIETMVGISAYFPSDFKTWGQGKVILTSRDNTIKNHKNVTHTIQIGELTDEEKLELFSKIMYSEKNIPHSLQENVKVFLKEIPSFPLDVTVAAYYLKTTNLSLEGYLERVKKNYKDFDDAQQALLKEAGDYHKTRYGIITLSLDQIIAAHPDFYDLLLLISLIDSQEISRNLLENIKFAPTIDNFIYHLKKYSFITEKTPNLNSVSMFSIHRSTQKIILDYFIKNFDLEKRNSSIKLIANNLENYASSIIEEENLIKMKRLENHYSAFLNHNDLLTEDLKSIIMSELGYIKHYLGNYIESKQLLEKAFNILSKDYNKEPIKYVQVLTYLGMSDRHLGNYKIARDLLEKCVAIYKNNSFKKHKNFADALLYLGMTYRHLGNYTGAKELMEEGLSVYEEYCPKNYAGIARALGYVGYIYRYLGDYKKAKDLIERSHLTYKEYLSNNHIDIAKTLLYLGTIQMDLYHYEEAKKFLEQSLEIYKEHSPDGGVAWALGFLGNIYKGLGEYTKAERALLQCLSIYQKCLPENHIDVAWVQAYLGGLYKTLGEYEKAKYFAENSYAIYEKNLGRNNVIISWILTYLGEIYQKLGKSEQSKAVLERSLSIHKAHFDHFHPRVGWVMLRLGESYINCGDYKRAENLLREALTIYKKNYMDDNIEIANAFSALGQVYLLKNHFDLAHDFFQKALIILQKQKNPEAYIILENSADLYLKKSLDAINKGSSQPYTFKNQAISCLKQALEIVTTHFPVNSPHKARIELKLKELEQS